MKIVLLGLPINDINLGCQALTYSTINMFEKISQEINKNISYVVFEGSPSSSALDIFCKNLKVDSNKISTYHDGNFYGFLRKIKHYKENLELIKQVKSADIIFNFTYGDSYSDIYGDDRFQRIDSNLRYISSLNTPLIFGSQTYGPFIGEENRKAAEITLKKAKKIIARDNESCEYVNQLTNRKCYTTGDMAFTLPKSDKYSYLSQKQDKIKVGINVSGLLVNDSKESMEKNFRINLDYNRLLDDILKFFAEPSYEIHLIGHVYADYIANKKIASTCKNVIVAPEFENPMDAKSYISEMDIFIGSRMHATIAAISSGVFTIPLAYSKKFKGVFELLDYPYVIDLNAESNESCMMKIVEEVRNVYPVYSKDKMKDEIDRINSNTVSTYKEILLNI